MSDFEPVPVADIPDMAHPGHKGRWQKLLDEFVAAGVPAAVVTLNGEHSGDVASSILTTLRKGSYPVRVTTRKPNVYLVRTDR